MAESPLDKVVRLAAAAGTPVTVHPYQRRSAKGTPVSVGGHTRGSGGPRNGSAPVPTAGRTGLVQPRLSPIQGKPPAITVSQAKSQAAKIQSTKNSAAKKAASGVAKVAATKNTTPKPTKAPAQSAASKLAGQLQVIAARKAAALAVLAARTAAQQKSQQQKAQQQKAKATAKPPAAAKAPAATAPKAKGGGLRNLAAGAQLARMIRPPRGGGLRGIGGAARLVGGRRGGPASRAVRSTAGALAGGSSTPKAPGAPSRRTLPTHAEMRAARIAHAAASTFGDNEGREALAIARGYSRLHTHGKNPLPKMF